MAATDKMVISTERAPAAIGPYSQAIRVGNLIFTSGMIPVDPKTAQIVGTDIATQTDCVLRNLSALLEAAGSGFFQVVKTTVFLKSMNDFPAMNEVYAKHFNYNPPARSTVEVARLPKDVLVEIECIAYQPSREPVTSMPF